MILSPYKPIEDIKLDEEKEREMETVFSTVNNAIIHGEKEGSLKTLGMKINVGVKDVIANRKKQFQKNLKRYE